MTAPLRPYQLAAIDEARKAIVSGKNRPVLQLPTGAGKTKIAAEITNMKLARGSRVAFVVPFLSLIDQTVAAFRREGMDDIGVIQADHELKNDDARVLVCSAQTLKSRKLFPHVALALIDEAHMQHQHVYDWMAAAPSIPFIGLSATPWSAGMGREGRYNALIKPVTTRQLIDAGFLSPPRVFAPSKPDLAGVRVSRASRDYAEGELSKVMCESVIVGNVVSEWTKRAENRPTIVFAVNRTHAKELQRAFNEHGIPAGYCDANTPREERASIAEQLRTGEIKLVVNINTLTAGFDAPFVSCIVFARPTLSKSLYVQAIGRGLRISPDTGKTDCLILDHAGATTSLGFVDTIDHDELDDGEKKPFSRSEAEGGEKTNLCKHCDAANPNDATECWHCGSPLKKARVIVEAGELVEMTAPRHERHEDAPKRSIAELSDDELFGMLRWYAYNRDYKVWWATRSFAEIRGRTSPYGVPLSFDKPPIQELEAWIKEKNRKYSESIRRAAYA